MTSSTRWALGLLGALLLIGGLAPLLVPHGAETIDLAARRGAPSWAHWFGTDDLGRDVALRVLVGARVSLAIGALSAVLAAALGLACGLVAGFAGGWVDALLMRLTDAMLAIPRLPLLMLAAATLRPGVPALVLLVAAVGWMEAARVVRTETRSIAARDFVAAARGLGLSTAQLVRRHVLPGLVPVTSVALTLAVGRGILLESTLSFLGVGVQPPRASWGNMLYQARTTLTSAPWLAIFPGLCIFFTVLACNALGNALATRARTDT